MALPPLTRLPRRTAASSPPPFINLCGDYRFLRAGYWALVDAELNGIASRPTPLQAVTAQNAAAALLVAAQAGVPTVRWSVAKRPHDARPPCILVPNAGQTDSSYMVQSERSAAAQWRRATQNGTRSALVVQDDGPLRAMKSVVGVTTARDAMFAWRLWEVFQMPLATVWYLASDDGPLFLSLDPLPLHELTERELRLFEEVSQRPMSPS